jgi:glycosyltransferase involved in cell wall biosynthesis
LSANLNIDHVGFVSDLHPIYSEADFFVLPSLEEGSPLVTYLALGAGLPVIASPMGSGGVITDGRQGFVVDPHDERALVNAIQTLCHDSVLRQEMAAASAVSAYQYTWHRVATRRVNLLMAHMHK